MQTQAVCTSAKQHGPIGIGLQSKTVGIEASAPHPTYIKGFAGTSSNLAPGWTLNREQSILAPPCPPRSPAMLPQTTLERGPSLSNREQSGASIQEHAHSCSELKC